jgi:hypothetical protein
VRRDILDFQIAYAKSILGRDNVVILCDRPTHAELARELPADVLLVGPMRDIWMRDFAPVRPALPVLFRYSAAAQAGKELDAAWVQAGFTRYAKARGLEFRTCPYVLDGGNLVDNGAAPSSRTGFWPTTLSTSPKPSPSCANNSAWSTWPSCRPIPKTALAHADGMAAFIASNAVAVTRYDEPLRAAVLAGTARGRVPRHRDRRDRIPRIRRRSP